MNVWTYLLPYIISNYLSVCYKETRKHTNYVSLVCLTLYPVRSFIKFSVIASKMLAYILFILNAQTDVSSFKGNYLFTSAFLPATSMFINIILNLLNYKSL